MKPQRGVIATAFLLVMFLVITLLATIFLFYLSTEVGFANIQKDSLQSLYLAYGGIEYALNFLAEKGNIDANYELKTSIGKINISTHSNYPEIGQNEIISTGIVNNIKRIVKAIVKAPNIEYPFFTFSETIDASVNLMSENLDIIQEGKDKNGKFHKMPKLDQKYYKDLALSKGNVYSNFAKFNYDFPAGKITLSSGNVITKRKIYPESGIVFCEFDLNLNEVVELNGCIISTGKIEFNNTLYFDQFNNFPCLVSSRGIYLKEIIVNSGAALIYTLEEFNISSDAKFTGSIYAKKINATNLYVKFDESLKTIPGFGWTYNYPIPLEIIKIEK
jgi:hypothetical protein